MTPKRKMFLAVAIIIVAVLGTGVIILRGSPGNYWVTPGELGEQAAASGSVRVGGKIVRDTLKSENGRLAFTISAPGESTKMPVEFSGYAPTAFSDLSEVIVEGELRAGVFYANNILVRCPENYMAEKAAVGLYKTLGIDGALYR